MLHDLSILLSVIVMFTPVIGGRFMERFGGAM